MTSVFDSNIMKIEVFRQKEEENFQNQEIIWLRFFFIIFYFVGREFINHYNDQNLFLNIE